jgi:hypothetical protein
MVPFYHHPYTFGKQKMTETWLGGATQFLDNRKSCVPQGHSENSPAFERRGLTLSPTSPAGTAENGGAATNRFFFPPAPPGLDFTPNFPGIEMPGYFRLFLRNRTPA